MANPEVVFSHAPGEWWYSHLAAALATRTTVREINLIAGKTPFNAPHLDISTAILANPGDALYLGSVAVIFRGINRMNFPTAVWTDYLPSNQILFSALRLFDAVFCTQRDSVEILKTQGCKNVHWLPFAFDTLLHNQSVLEKTQDAAFVGSLDLPATRDERIDLLTALEGRFSMNNFRAHHTPDEMMKAYNSSKMAINIPVPGGFNMRTFEAMASGALLLTKDVGNGQRELFSEGKHFVVYKDKADLIEKIEYFLKNERERMEIAECGRREVLAKHTYGHRADEFLQIMSGVKSGSGRSSDPAVERRARTVFYRYILHRPDLLLKLALEKDVPLLERVKLMGVAGGKFLKQRLR